ncbi:phage terminase large subunit GpA-like protein [Rhodoligotrophos appendicifer]|uniref:phage terminase large subunit family protein n=1 Tax=Rhodoligotrophos appendicifer TaxID=987056 RepID=UPI001186BC78|nr:terminase gpA endonuclease subunit [Rhodoligotrophos appendicifer]
MTIHITNAQRLAMEALAEVLSPPPPVDYLAWAEANIVFSERESPFPGPYNRTLFPYFDEVLRALGPEDPCRFVTMMKSAQLGGTVLGNIFTGGSLAMDPGDILYVHPTEDNARRWSKMKLSPMLKGTPALCDLFPQKSRDGSDSVMYKERRDGRGAIQISGANSPASLSQVTMRRQVQDDLAKWEMNAAGDPEVQADSRSRSHEFAKILKVSTPLVQPGCRITRSFDAGSQEYPYVPCPHCEHMQVLEWENMLQHLDEARPENACFVCVECGGVIEEHHRRSMLKGLEWRAQNPLAKREHRSFYLWSAYSYLQSWERIAREWLKAKGDPASEQSFLNDTVGLAYKAQGESVPWEEIRDRASVSVYARGTIPVGALLLTIGVDCQADRVEWQVIGWGRDFRRHVIEYGVFPGHVTDAGCQEKLTGLVSQSWRNAAGRDISADMIAIDGNAWTEDVWSWVRKHPSSKVIMVRGVANETAPRIQRVKKERTRDGRLLKYSRRFFNFGTSVMKMSLYRDLGKQDPEMRGYVGFPKGLDDEYFRQLTAEHRKPVKNKAGFTVYQWVKDPNQANEGLDTMLQAEAAATKLGVRSMPDAVWDRLEAEREAPLEEQQLDFEEMPLTAAAPPPAVVAPILTRERPPMVSPRVARSSAVGR